MLVSKISETLTLCVSASLVVLPFVSGYPTFLFAQIVWAVSFIRFYESNANITHSIGISKKRNAKVTRKRQLSRTTVCKRLSDFFVCTSRMSGIVYTILRNEIYRKREKVLRNRLFGYTTVNNNSEGAILSWIAPYGYPQTNQGERLRNAYA